VQVIRRTLFASDTIEIGRFEIRPASDACGEVERQGANVVVLPVSGVFARHDAPGRSVVGTPSHAVLVAADTPYRLSFPGGIGDRSLILRLGRDVALDELHSSAASDGTPSHGLLPPGAMMLRNLLWRRLDGAAMDAFEAEALGLDLVATSLRSMRRGGAPPRRSAQRRRRLALERVKEAVAAAPAERWSVAALATVANLSPFHLCRVFRQMVGKSLYDYVVQERLAQALAAVLDGGDDLTAIALDAGFASHSHFTERFRRFFGCTPTSLRRIARTAPLAELRKITTARRRQAG
jgi:AraC family transcriptional regulator